MNVDSVDISGQIFKEKKKEMLLKMIMRQTNYTKEESIEQLKKWNYNTIYVMKAYLNPKFQEKKKEEENKSTNERMMKEIRSFCDKGTRLYNLKKKMQQQQEILRLIASQKKSKEDNKIINI